MGTKIAVSFANIFMAKIDGTERNQAKRMETISSPSGTVIKKTWINRPFSLVHFVFPIQIMC